MKCSSECVTYENAQNEKIYENKKQIITEETIMQQQQQFQTFLVCIRMLLLNECSVERQIYAENWQENIQEKEWNKRTVTHNMQQQRQKKNKRASFEYLHYNSLSSVFAVLSVIVVIAAVVISSQPGSSYGILRCRNVRLRNNNLHK